MTWCSSRTPKRSVSPSSRHGRLARTPSSWSLHGGGHDVLRKSGKYSCVVCCSGVDRNSILCSQYMLWVHKTSSGVTKWLVEDPNYICPRCKGESQPIDGRTVTGVDVDGIMLDMEAAFCCRGAMLYSGGCCDNSIAARCCLARGKFRKLLLS